METQGISIHIRQADGYEAPASIRDALEGLAQAVNAEAQKGEVEGYVADFGRTGPFNPLAPTPGKFGPKEPLQTICLGGFSCGDFGPGSVDCSWIYNY